MDEDNLEPYDCEPDCEPDEDSPEEDDIFTSDHRRYYQNGKLILNLGEDDDANEALNEHMERDGFWPNVWYISDHGNAVLIGVG